jgi:glutathione synthase/RimK-type ligase-like ATP-grasp enzyme
MDALFRDKSFSYTLLHEELAMPRTKQYMDPAVEERWQPLVTHATAHDIATDILEGFQLPVIVKRNSGSHGNHVFLIDSHDAAVIALETIFEKANSQYDPIALAQEAVVIAREYRVLWFRGKVVLMYEKLTPEGKAHSMSPFGNPGAEAVIVSEDDAAYVSVAEFLSQSPTAKGFEYCGFDVATDAAGKHWLLEVNAWPGTEHLTKHAGDDVLVDMWKRILLELQHA